MLDVLAPLLPHALHACWVCWRCTACARAAAQHPRPTPPSPGLLWALRQDFPEAGPASIYLNCSVAKLSDGGLLVSSAQRRSAAGAQQHGSAAAQQRSGAAAQQQAPRRRACTHSQHPGQRLQPLPAASLGLCSSLCLRGRVRSRQHKFRCGPAFEMSHLSTLTLHTPHTLHTMQCSGLLPRRAHP